MMDMSHLDHLLHSTIEDRKYLDFNEMEYWYIKLFHKDLDTIFYDYDGFVGGLSKKLGEHREEYGICPKNPSTVHNKDIIVGYLVHRIDSSSRTGYIFDHVFGGNGPPETGFIEIDYTPEIRDYLWEAIVAHYTL